MIKGQSFTIGIIFDAGYDKNRIQSLELNIGEKIVGKLSDNTILLEDDVYFCRLTSQQTSFLPFGNIPITVHLQDSILGVRKPVVGTLEINTSKSKTTSEKKNELVDYYIELKIDGDQITTNATLQTMFQGAPGTTPHIGENGNWWIGETDTGVNAEGRPGEVGPPGNPQGQYNIVVSKKDAVWIDDWLKVSHSTSVSNKEIIIYRLSIQLGDGIKSLGAIVAYPRAETYNGSVPNEFYIKDVDAIISRTTNFDHIQIEYSILDVPVGTPPNYDTRNKLGENVIQDENSGQSYHSSACAAVFKYSFPDLWEIHGIEVVETIKDALTGNASVNALFEPKYMEIKQANMLFRPYVDGARTEQIGSNPNILKVGSHYANYSQLGSQLRRDITSGSDVFLTNVIAVTARVDDTTTLIGQASHGYGVEFFEDWTKEEMDKEFPEKTLPMAMAGVYTDETGTILYSTANPGFSQYTYVGDKVIVRYGTEEETWEFSEVAEILGPNSIRLTTPITLISEEAIKYVWHNVNLSAATGGGQAQSQTCSLVGAKLKAIKVQTGVNWQIVREAARMTARKTIDGVFANHQGHWDMYRGFGKIHVEGAIQYIKDNYTGNSDYIASLAADVARAHGINKLLKYNDLTDNTPVPKKYIEEKLGDLLTILQTI